MLSEALCITCGYQFAFDASYFTARGLRVPKRCRSCRDQRRETTTNAPREPGRVVVVHESYAFVETVDARFFVHRSNVAAADWPLVVGDVVTFEPATDGADYARPGRAPRAFAVQREP